MIYLESVEIVNSLIKIHVRKIVHVVLRLQLVVFILKKIISHEFIQKIKRKVRLVIYFA
jgi:hypothetical protein